MKTYKVKHIESGNIFDWTLEQVLDEINRDHSDGWIPYDETDFMEGWNEWVEGGIYEMCRISQQIDGRWKCNACGYEWSACLGDDEVPEYCECLTGE